MWVAYRRVEKTRFGVGGGLLFLASVFCTYEFGGVFWENSRVERASDVVILLKIGCRELGLTSLLLTNVMAVDVTVAVDTAVAIDIIVIPLRHRTGGKYESQVANP